MNRATYLVLSALLTISLFAGAQSTAPPSQDSGVARTADAQLPSRLLRILTPVADQRLSDNAITVRYELINSADPGSTPNFLVQLDGNNPVRTSTTEQNFTGLASGPHSVMVALVDAYSKPIPGGRAAVQFVVGQQGAQPESEGTSAPSDDKKLKLGGVTFEKPSAGDPNPDLPKSNSPLPLISVIGFGILVGGIVSAMKTRS